MKPVIFCLTVILYFFVSCSNEPGNVSTGNITLDSFIKRKVDSLYTHEKFPGMLIGVLEGDKRFYYTSGFAIPDSKIAFDSTTIFEAGSITKTFTSFILEKVLLENGISDSAMISSWLPDSVRVNKPVAEIRFFQLLNHTSGLPRLPYNFEPMTNKMAPYDDYTEDDLYAFLKIAELRAINQSNYSNLGMGLAGVLAQKISGKGFNQLLEEYIYRPFALNAEGSPGTGNRRKSQGYFNDMKSEYWKMNILAPAGSLQCTASEMLSYLQQTAVPRDPGSAMIIEKLLTPTASVKQSMKVGRGWHIIERDSLPDFYWHNGGTYGFSTFAGFLKGQNKAVIVVINQFNRNETCDAMGFSILKRLSR